MGTEFRIVVDADSAELAAAGARAAFARIAALDAELSDWKSDSELSRLSRQPQGVPMTLGEDLCSVLTRAAEIRAATDGAFDVTVGPFVVLWRRAVREGELPTEARLRTAARAVGGDVLQLHAQDRSAVITVPHARLDLGGIAKGRAADEALRELAKLGLTRALVDGGGDLAVGDPPRDAEGWIVALQPLEEGKEPSEAVCVARCGIATSGDLFQFVEIGGERYAHIVDPRTGLGVRGRRTATVIAQDGTTADALASACCVLDPEAALAAVARVPGATAMVRRAGSEGVITVHSPDFPALVHR